VDWAATFRNLKRRSGIFGWGNRNRQALLINDIELDSKKRAARSVTVFNHPDLVSQFQP
jgi:hypothetical protein